MIYCAKKVSLIAFILLAFLGFKVYSRGEGDPCGGPANEIAGTSKTWSSTSNEVWKNNIKNNWMPSIIDYIKMYGCTGLQAPLNDLRKKMGLPAINF